jgi:hypothetical protein
MNTNVIGPLIIQRQPDDEWDEIIYDTQYYYFKKDTYHYVSSPPAPRPGWEWYEIGDNHYIVKSGEPNFDFMNEDGVICKFMNELSINAIKEKFDIHIYVDFENVKSFKEIFETLINYPEELFRLLQYTLDKLNNKIQSGEIDENKFMNEIACFLEKTKFIDYEHRFRIIKYIILMLREEVNYLCSIPYQIPINDKWTEIKHEGLYYYLRKGCYEHVEEVKDLKDEYNLCEIGENKYVICLHANSI